MKKPIRFTLFLFYLLSLSIAFCNEKMYTVGAGDILEVSILKPDQITNRVTVSPSGEISVVFLGNVKVRGKTITQIQRLIQYRLARGYFKYPIVTVSLMESHSRNFTISGAVARPGTYPLGENTTVLRAISLAGGFSRFGSKSKVKILRAYKNRPGQQIIKIDIGKVMEGDTNADIVLQAGDIIIVSEGLW